MEDLEQSVSDVSEASSTSPESESLSNVPEKTSEASSGNQSKPEVPFHEHPRFKELINQRNEFSQRLQEYEKRFQDIDGKISKNTPKEETPESKLIQRLKGIDPEFGSWAEQQHTAKMQLEKDLAEQKQWRQNYEANNQKTQINSSLEKLHTDNKVPAPMREFYEAALRQVALNNPNLRMNDLPGVYKTIHDKFSKFMETEKRSTLASYSQDKTKGSAVPASSKGPSPKSGTSKVEYSKDPQEARKQIVERAMKSLRNQ